MSALSRARSTKGANDFLALSKQLKAAGKTELRKELHKAVQGAAKPLLPKVKQAARDSLPKKGGLNERIARKPIRVQARTGAATAGVRIVGAKVDPRINEGRVYHPVFGRQPGVVQRVPRAVGYFDRTIEAEAPAVRKAVEDVLKDFVNRIADGS